MANAPSALPSLGWMPGSETDRRIAFDDILMSGALRSRYIQGSENLQKLKNGPSGNFLADHTATLYSSPASLRSTQTSLADPAGMWTALPRKCSDPTGPSAQTIAASTTTSHKKRTMQNTAPVSRTNMDLLGETASAMMERKGKVHLKMMEALTNTKAKQQLVGNPIFGANTSLLFPSRTTTTSLRSALCMVDPAVSLRTAAMASNVNGGIPVRYAKNGKRRAIPFPLKVSFLKNYVDCLWSLVLFEIPFSDMMIMHISSFITRSRFDSQLMKVLSDPQNSRIISWMPGGRSFAVIDPELFVQEILPKHFKAAKFASFTRKLHRWGFSRVDDIGREFFHSFFQRNRFDLAEKISCVYKKTEEMSVQRKEVKPRIVSSSPTYSQKIPDCSRAGTGVAAIKDALRPPTQGFHSSAIAGSCFLLDNPAEATTPQGLLPPRAFLDRYRQRRRQLALLLQNLESRINDSAHVAEGI